MPGGGGGALRARLSYELFAAVPDLTLAPETDQARPVPRTVVFSPDGNRLAIAYINGFVMIYDVTLRRRTSWWIVTFDTPPSSVAFSPDSQRLLAASPDSLKEWDATTGKLLSRSPVPGLRGLTRMTYTNDGRWLIISHPRSLSCSTPKHCESPWPTCP